MEKGAMARFVAMFLQGRCRGERFQLFLYNLYTAGVGCGVASSAMLYYICIKECR